MNHQKTRTGLVFFARLKQLDLTGPAEVFGRMPGAEVHLHWKALEPVTADRDLNILPTTTFSDYPRLDMIWVLVTAQPDSWQGNWQITAYRRERLGDVSIGPIPWMDVCPIPSPLRSQFWACDGPEPERPTERKPCATRP